ncbi:MAG TPA: hypothetical protein VME47_23660 [Acetobacteraceae bacterium]|nr:hypothetical protein [Acetobacteraceae bacterium]
MRQYGLLAILALPLLGMSAAQAQSPAAGGTVLSPEVPAPFETPSVPAEPPAVFSIGNVPVRVWSPVPAPYNTAADRTGADNPIQNVPDWFPTPFSD